MPKHPTMAKAAAQYAKVIFENDKVRVVDLKLKPGQKIPMHTHSAYFTYAFNPFSYRSTSPDGKAKTRTAKAGEVSWYEAESHAVDGLAKEGRVLVVELK